MKRIAIVTSPEPAFNEKKVSQHISEMLLEEYCIDIITGNVSWSISENKRLNKFTYEPYLDCGYDVTWTINALSKHHKKREINAVINASHTSTVGLGVSIFGIISSIPSIVRFTGDPNHDPTLYNKLTKSISKGVVHNIIPFITAILADYCIALGPDYRDRLAKIKASDRISILPQPIKRNRFENMYEHEKSVLRRHIGISDEHKMVLFVGRLTWYKGIDRLKHIAKQVYIKDRSVRFCIVGADPKNEHTELSGLPNVRIIGPVKNSHIHLYYNTADIFVLPSRSEGLPNVILEALAAELPIVASPVGEISHYVSHTTTDPKDYVDFILDPSPPVDRFPTELVWSKLQKKYLSYFENSVL